MTALAGRPVAELFGSLPTALRGELLAEFNKIVTNYRLGKWEPSELSGGKLCEVVYSILDGLAKGSLPSKSRKPRNMVDACNALAGGPPTLPRSVRIGIPRALIALYEIRNNRNVGHVGGDVDPNHMDAAVVVAMAKWILAELIRILHTVDPTEATAAVEALTSREVPMVWASSTGTRLLNPGLSTSQAILVLTYAQGGPVPVTELLASTEYGNASRFRGDLLRDLHRQRLIEFNQTTDTVEISPTGIRKVETEIPMSLG